MFHTKLNISPLHCELFIKINIQILYRIFFVSICNQCSTSSILLDTKVLYECNPYNILNVKVCDAGCSFETGYRIFDIELNHFIQEAECWTKIANLNKQPK